MAVITAKVGFSLSFNDTVMVDIEKYQFNDDGVIPNSRYPLLLYRACFTAKGTEGAAWLEKRFKQNDWYNTWRYGIYPFHHYHSTSHEVLGCFSGTALLHLGGEKGEKVTIQAGDIVVIPAGVGHKCLQHSPDFTVVGAYPEGKDWDLLRGEKGERPQADQNIAQVPLPGKDPYFGTENGLLTYWK
ncbi:cupin domain-containing protein [Parapedobacter koreensis]|uniref:cupin domain-containing protein n=1 Tax=Parapedobacter koreensis TaxID=332977 RepID=UPI001C4362D1|nr:cupin domain-containing protein [Parapedobacter koreensis]